MTVKKAAKVLAGITVAFAVLGAVTAFGTLGAVVYTIIQAAWR